MITWSLNTLVVTNHSDSIITLLMTRSFITLIMCGYINDAIITHTDSRAFVVQHSIKGGRLIPAAYNSKTIFKYIEPKFGWTVDSRSHEVTNIELKDDVIIKFLNNVITWVLREFGLNQLTTRVVTQLKIYGLW